MDIIRLMVRADGDEESTPQCVTTNEYDGRMGVRISSIFVILIGSCLGAVFPVFAKRHKGLGIPDWSFFVAKYFGSGVIIATAFIHLLAPANEALGNECLTGVITKYPWPEAIALMVIFLMFFLELMTMRYGNFGGEDGHGHSHGHNHSHDHVPSAPQGSNADSISMEGKRKTPPSPESHNHHHAPGEDHLGHTRDHRDNGALSPDWEERGIIPETYAAQMTAIFILEFGVIFHSIFIGLTLAVAGEEFITLYIVLVFHQTFEGLGLGSRLATVPWPKSKHLTPYVLGFAYGLSTPIAIAIGLGVRKSYPPEGRTALLTNGIFDSISAGILIYTGLVELMAHEFMFSPYMQKGPVSRMLGAFTLMVLGAGLMALLGYWA
ncbi:low-affinity zinc ion transporter-like protein [Aaosphaeria arxii CBS 175.79]|uniref:Low-affinity zinc ion transporter-like protein n=1 Tax=Aaosphaeria arxii CBS 175.79 TaxID=1450172 RepID=A0A6A5YBC2_9PLEO|nr:low-affinity zinc ion transporter-like protein [Aaosphaeria arxii CBS 175.79]KAF2022001.1 low-affinity zinc ion transporter-like protein [Aaosphaeria arxii CBS 175.79]